MRRTKSGNYVINFSSYAEKDKKKLKQSGFEEKARKLLSVIQMNPFQDSHPREKLRGDYQGGHSRRINIQHRLV
ncbi:MAG: Txe/YoeB family addiction module toxin [Bacilli bacterium]|nr:Txe/YoeB family addiction module toxin [Bacilli bacterium]MCH4210190.1 Txe/YoeB family addiction module toxin [Bacilli bacterium]MCH4228173.1 Txe/YoeB family addiction module toxin [Bacilli bacterium]MCH4277829.1 Txe/YoeB family addiction module toxin [Bacilli bacterium]MCI2055188.1 Txe/YoeB family addiction module toxin [Bacilli bacterium]